MNRIRLYFLLILPVLFLLGGCTNDDTDLGLDNDSSDVVLLLDLPALSEANTRGETGLPNENRINSINLLLFDRQGTKGCIKTVAGTPVPPASGENGNRQAFKASLPEEGSYDVVVVANSVLPAGLTGKTKAEVQKLLEVSHTGKWDLAAKAIPMWGEFENFDQTETTGQTVSMTRMLARVNIDATAVSGDFQLTGIYIRNYHQQGMLIPHPDNFSNNKATAPSLSDTPNMGTASLPYSPTGKNVSENQIYLFETVTKGEYSPEDGGPVVTGDWQKNTCIILKGKYANDSQETYYRMDFISKEWEWLDILRNHTYNFVITHVFGPGYDTEKEAFESIGTSNIEGELIPWDDNDTGDIWVDGQYSLQVDPVNMQCYSRGVEEENYTGTSAALKESIKTYFTVDCKYDRYWKIDIDKDSFNADQAWYDNLKWFYRPYGSTMAAWQEYNMSTGLPAGKYDMYVVCGENTLYNEPITGNFKVRAGRKTIPVTFTQTSSVYLGYWGDELVKSIGHDGNEQYKFKKKLYVREDDDAGKGKFSENDPTDHLTPSHLGKVNTYGLVKNTALETIAPNICFDSNKADITGVDDPNFVWFLPSVKQAVIMLVTRTAVGVASENNKADHYISPGSRLPYYHTSSIRPPGVFSTGGNIITVGIGSQYQALATGRAHDISSSGEVDYHVRCVRESD